MNHKANQAAESEKDAGDEEEKSTFLSESQGIPKAGPSMISEEDLTDLQHYAYLDVNPVIVTEDSRIILARRVREVVEGGKWHLPGGRVLAGERVESALTRHSKRKTGLDVTLQRGSLVEDLVGVYDDPSRDPREHVISFAYLCRIVGGEAIPGNNVDEVSEFSEKDVNNLVIGFDHRRTVLDSLKRIGVHPE